MNSTDPCSEETLFLTALAMPEGARAAYLDQACAGNAPRRAAVDALLRAHQAADGFLASVSGVSQYPGMPASRTEEQPGDWIGRYKLLQKIGEGGCGIVYMAEQEEPIRRRVALKVIKLGMDTKAVVARFDAERQALAMMDHPNVAKVFDAGATDAGRPFFVMELVRGIPVTKYCDEQSLATEKRLELFSRICAALQHAHQKGIIHRDIKPSNILVTLHDGVPVPKVIDFGIAKATQGKLTDLTYFTAFEQFVGTPAYMSPEQAEMSGLDVDTRSDIYSLGVLLYELLAGRPPFDPKTFLAAGLDEMRRLIREVDPPKPSARLSTLTKADQTTVAKQRGTAPAELSTKLAGDLDWIVMRCLEKDRARRYATPSELVADIERHLRNEPVIARPPSTTYLLRKLVRRHKAGFVASAAVALSLIVGLVVSVVLLVREQRAALKSEQVVRVMREMITNVRPSVALGQDTKLLRRILERTLQRIEVELASQPAVAADLRDTIGEVYLELGDHKTAEPILRAAVSGHRFASGNQSEATAASLTLWGQALRQLNKDGAPEAEVVLQEALAIRRKLFGSEHPRFADTLAQLALVPNRGRDEKQKMLEMVLAIRRKAFGNDHPDVANAIFNLGSAAQSEIDHFTAARLFEEALAIRRRWLPANDPALATVLSNLGWNYAHELDRQADAANAYREALAIQRAVVGDQHPRTVSLLLRLTGQFPAKDVSFETRALVREFVARQRMLLPHGSPLLAPTLLALASIEEPYDAETAQARVEEARLIFEQSRRDSPFESDVVHGMWFFAWSKFVGGAPAEGLVMAQEAWKLAPRVWGERAINTWQSAHTLAWIYVGLGRHAEAAGMFDEVLRRMKEPEGDRIRLGDVAALGACYRAMNRVADSREYLVKELSAVDAMSASGGGPLPPQIAHVRCQLGLTLLREGRFEEAEPILREAMADYEDPKLPAIQLRLHPPGRARSALGQALAGQRKFEEGALLVVQAFEELKANEHRIAGNRATVVREAFDAVIALYTAWGRLDLVAEWQGKLGDIGSKPAQSETLSSK